MKELNVSEGSSSGSSKVEEYHHDKRISLLHATTVEVDQNDDNEPVRNSFNSHSHQQWKKLKRKLTI